MLLHSTDRQLVCFTVGLGGWFIDRPFHWSRSTQRTFVRYTMLYECGGLTSNCQVIGIACVTWLCVDDVTHRVTACVTWLCVDDVTHRVWLCVDDVTHRVMACVTWLCVDDVTHRVTACVTWLCVDDVTHRVTACVTWLVCRRCHTPCDGLCYLVVCRRCHTPCVTVSISCINTLLSSLFFQTSSYTLHSWL